MGPKSDANYIVIAKVVTGELGARLGPDDDALALVVGILASGAHGWRAFECETLDTDGTYVGTVRLTTHPAAGAAPAVPLIVPVAADEDERAPGAALRRARPKRTPAQRRVAAALAGGQSDPERRKGDSGTLSDLAAQDESEGNSIG